MPARSTARSSPPQAAKTRAGRKPSGLLIGMVHVAALPGTPVARLSVQEIARRAADEARILADAGFDGVLVENMHDTPYVAGEPGPEITSAMTAACVAVKAAIGPMRMGVQILAAGNRAALAVAHASGADFIRCENFVFAQVADEGLMPTAEAGALLRYRRVIGAERVQIYADIDKKHASHALTADVPVAELAAAAEFFRADGLIVTGFKTGQAASDDDLAAARHGADLPLFVGSGVTAESAPHTLERCDGVIVGSWLKKSGKWDGPLDPARCRDFVKAARGR